MYLNSGALTGVQPESPAELPPEITRLFRRDFEIASIVYRSGLVTARDVEVRLGGQLKNATVRALLNRLVAKGLVLRRQIGRGRTFIYVPALTQAAPRENALVQFASDFYAGSLERVADDLDGFLTRATTLTQLLESYDRRPPGELEGLARQMRAVADAVYRDGIYRATEILAALAGSPRGGVRTTIQRLQMRGLIKRRLSGRKGEKLCLPAVAPRSVRRLALKRLVDERFEGSAEFSLRTALQLLRSPVRSNGG